MTSRRALGGAELLTEIQGGRLGGSFPVYGYQDFLAHRRPRDRGGRPIGSVEDLEQFELVAAWFERCGEFRVGGAPRAYEDRCAAGGDGAHRDAVTLVEEWVVRGLARWNLAGRADVDELGLLQGPEIDRACAGSFAGHHEPEESHAADRVAKAQHPAAAGQVAKREIALGIEV